MVNQPKKVIGTENNHTLETRIIGMTGDTDPPPDGKERGTCLEISAPEGLEKKFWLTGEEVHSLILQVFGEARPPPKLMNGCVTAHYKDKQLEGYTGTYPT